MTSGTDVSLLARMLVVRLCSSQEGRRVQNRSFLTGCCLQLASAPVVCITCLMVRHSVFPLDTLKERNSDLSNSPS